jgi:hypothetical protein
MSIRLEEAKKPVPAPGHITLKWKQMVAVLLIEEGSGVGGPSAHEWPGMKPARRVEKMQRSRRREGKGAVLIRIVAGRKESGRYCCDVQRRQP